MVVLARMRLDTFQTATCSGNAKKIRSDITQQCKYLQHSSWELSVEVPEADLEDLDRRCVHATAATHTAVALGCWTLRDAEGHVQVRRMGRQGAHLGEEVAEDGAEDAGHCVAVKLADADVVEVASKSGGDERAAAARKSHRGDKLAVHHLSERVGPVIPAQQSSQPLTSHCEAVAASAGHTRLNETGRWGHRHVNAVSGTIATAMLKDRGMAVAHNRKREAPTLALYCKSIPTGHGAAGRAAPHPSAAAC